MHYWIDSSRNIFSSSIRSPKRREASRWIEFGVFYAVLIRAITRMRTLLLMQSSKKSKRLTKVRSHLRAQRRLSAARRKTSFNDLDSWYFSSFIDNRRPEVYDFIRKEYLEKGAALFGRETTESINDFREAIGGRLLNLNDYGVKTIITSSVQRIRNYAHINSLRQARYKYGRITAIIDERTSEICLYLDGKFVRVGIMAATVDRLTKLEPGDYALEMYKSELGKAYSSDPVNYVKERVGADGVIDDSLVAEGRGFPPYHPNCRTRVFGIDKEVVEGARN